MDILEELLEDVETGVLDEKDMIYVIRKASSDQDGYHEILDYEYSPIIDEDMETIRVSWVIKELSDRK